MTTERPKAQKTDMFGYDASTQMLVCLVPGEPPVGITVANLRRFGWVVDEAELKATLPAAGRAR